MNSGMFPVNCRAGEVAVEVEDERGKEEGRDAADVPG